MAKKRIKKKTNNTKQYVLNCIPTTYQEDDSTFEDAVDTGSIDLAATVPSSKDLRKSWWKINQQGATGACVGFATAYGVLSWHYVNAGKIDKSDLPSARFIWMVNKETDGITS